MTKTAQRVHTEFDFLENQGEGRPRSLERVQNKKNSISRPERLRQKRAVNVSAIELPLIKPKLANITESREREERSKNKKYKEKRG